MDFNDAPTPLSVALAYARAGVPVFPCNPLNKQPLTPHGFKDATADLFKVRAWWTQWPQAMIGMPTGLASGWWALDIDNDPARGKHGLQSLAEIGHDFAELADYAHARTAGGGYHVFFRVDPEHLITNARGRLPKHVDVRGEGGYVILAGSRTSDGRIYEWLNPWEEAGEGTAPDWLLALLHAQADPLDFNSAPRLVSPTERVAAIAPGTWHENTRDFVARMVREGASDETIIALAPRFTEPGYTVDQTARELLTHARTAREKWGYQPKDLALGDSQAQADDVYRVFSIDELAALEPPEWRVEGILPAYGSSTIYGAYQSFKTFVALDLLLCLAAGRPWHGRETKPCGVLYIAGEGQFGIAQRVLGWCHARLGGERPELFKALPEAVAIPQPGSLEKLMRTVDALPFVPGVIALDTVTRMSGGGSLNDEKDMQQYVLGMDRLRLHSGAHIMNIGHTGKDKEKGLLGSIVLPAAMETIIYVERKGDALKLVNSNPRGKQKDGPNFEDIAFRVQKVDFHQAEKASTTLVLMPDIDPVEATEEPDDAVVGRPQGAVQQAIVGALRKAKGEPLGLSRLLLLTRKEESAVRKALRALVEKQVLKVTGVSGEERWQIV